MIPPLTVTTHLLWPFRDNKNAPPYGGANKLNKNLYGIVTSNEPVPSYSMIEFPHMLKVEVRLHVTT